MIHRHEKINRTFISEKYPISLHRLITAGINHLVLYHLTLFLRKIRNMRKVLFIQKMHCRQTLSLKAKLCVISIMMLYLCLFFDTYKVSEDRFVKKTK